VWVDYYGNEHEIESMPLDYVRNVIDGAVSVAASALTLVAQGSDPEGATQSALEASVEAQSEPGAEALEEFSKWVAVALWRKRDATWRWRWFR